LARTPARSRLPKEFRREQIAVAARHVFAQRGLAGAKTREIAEAANVTETILYRHFGSKEEIFEAAILEPVERLASDLLRLTAGFSRVDPGRRLEMSEQVHDEIRQVVQEITPLLGVALFSDRTAGQEFYRTRLVPLLGVASEAIRQAMSPRQQKVVAPETLLLTIIGMYFGLSLEALYLDTPVDWPAATHQLTHLVAFGLPPVTPADEVRTAGRAETGPSTGRGRRGR
jgi:AcrR family transcriptional regulator